MHIEKIEQSILNTALLDRDAMFDLIHLADDIFSKQKHRSIFVVMKEMSSNDETVNFSNLYLELESRKMIDEKNIVLEFSAIPKEHNYKNVIKKLEKARLKRYVEDIVVDLHNAIKEGKTDYKKFIDALHDIIDENNEHNTEESFHGFIKNTDFDLMFSSNDFVSTGIADLDERIGGLVKGDITIIGARPGEGKTAIALQIADDGQGVPFYVSLEMKKKQLYARLLSKKTGIPPKVIMKKQVYENRMADVLAAHMYYKENKKMDVYDGGGDFREVVTAIKKHIKSGASFVVIDYLQLIHAGHGENKNAEVSYISRMLKIMAMKYNIPIVVLSQLNREVEKQDRQPRLSDLRDSGSIEQDSSVVLFLHEGEIIIAKDRFGETGKITTLYFNKPASRFDSKNIESNFKNTMSYIHD